MRVLFVSQHAVLLTEAGGTRHFMLAKELVALGHEVTIVASSISYFTHVDSRLGKDGWWKVQHVEGVRFLWIRTPPYSGNSASKVANMLVFAHRIQSAVRAAKLANPDIVVGSTPHLFSAHAALRLARKMRTSFVLEVRDLWPQTLIDLGKVSEFNIAVYSLKLIERKLYQSAEHIITLLPFSAAHMVEKGASREGITWLPNGVTLDFVPNSLPTEPADVVTVMYAGSHGLANGLDSLLDAAAIVQRRVGPTAVRFRFVGEGPLKGHLRARADAEGLANVSFEAAVPKRQIFSLLSEADILIATLKDSPLYRFGISLNKLYDYMAVARPVVFGVNASNNPIADAGAGISVPPENPEALAAAVLELVAAPPSSRQQYGERGRAYVESHHNWAHLAKTLNQIFISLVPEPQGGENWRERGSPWKA